LFATRAARSLICAAVFLLALAALGSSPLVRASAVASRASLARTAPASPHLNRVDTRPAGKHDDSARLAGMSTPVTLSNGEGDDEDSVGDAADGADSDAKQPTGDAHDKIDDYVLAHGTSTRRDPVLQTQRGGLRSRTSGLASSTSFDGVGQGFTGPQGTISRVPVPSDNNIAVSPSYVVEVVNTHLAVFSKTGTTLYGPAQINTLFAGFGGACETSNDGDPVVSWDRAAGRWVVSQFANVTSASGPYYECVAISQTADPMGSYYRYSFQYADFPDYPKLGVWPDAYYMTYNRFTPGGSFLGGEACAMNRANMLQGLPATQQCYNTSTGGVLPSDLDSSAPPPTGAPNLLLGLTSSGTSIASWRFHVDWTTPANTTFTGPVSVPVAPYSAACGGGACIQQPGTTDRLDSLGDRLLYRLAYRNMGDHESWLVTHGVNAGTVVGARWYELRAGTSGRPAVYQQGSYAPDGYHWMSSSAMDGRGDIGLGFSASSATLHPSVHVTGRLSDDDPGQMTQAEGSIIDGSGSQSQGTLSRDRWGDYSSMRVDPADDCAFWYANEYLPADGDRMWHTRIGTFQLPGCTSAPTNDFGLSADAWSSTVTAGFSRTSTITTSVRSGSAVPVTFSTQGLPSGAKASFASAMVTSGASTRMTISTAATTPPGTYLVRVRGTSGATTHTTSYTLTVAPQPSFVSVGDVSVSEAAGSASFTVTRSGGTAGAVSVRYFTSNGSAQAGSDYTSLSPTVLDFAAGERTKTVVVPILGDTVDEPDETFSLHLDSPVGGTISDDTGQATIVDNDASVTFAVGDVQITEGNSGTKNASFTVTRGGSSTYPVSVRYFTSNGSAQAGSDYTSLPATVLGFAAGERTKKVLVPILGDTVDESNETFSLHLDSPVGGTVIDDTGQATILNDDRDVYFSVNDIVVSEGDSGTSNASFTVTRAGSSTYPVSVRYYTSNGSAQAGSDYTSLPATVLDFAAGEKTKTVLVPILGDTVDESNETFSLHLDSPVGGTVGDDTGNATIEDDDD
jgi:hypothetical protein